MEYKHKYNGSFTQEQIDAEKKDLHRLMYWLLIYKDPKTSKDYVNVNFDLCVKNIMNRLQGFNELLGKPQEIVDIMSLLESARIETHKEPFDFKNFRKIVLDAHATLDHFGSGKHDNTK